MFVKAGPNMIVSRHGSNLVSIKNRLRLRLDYNPRKVIILNSTGVMAIIAKLNH